MRSEVSSAWVSLRDSLVAAAPQTRPARNSCSVYNSQQPAELTSSSLSQLSSLCPLAVPAALLQSDLCANRTRSKPPQTPAFNNRKGRTTDRENAVKSTRRSKATVQSPTFVKSERGERVSRLFCGQRTSQTAVPHWRALDSWAINYSSLIGWSRHWEPPTVRTDRTFFNLHYVLCSCSSTFPKS